MSIFCNASNYHDYLNEIMVRGCGSLSADENRMSLDLFANVCSGT